MTSNSNDPLARLDATAQAALVESGEVSADELVAAACARIERIDDRLGAVPIRLCEQGLADVARVPAHARFAAVPFLMKDVGARQAGQPYYAANRALRDADHRASEDTPLGARFREVGLVTVGKSNSPEFGMQSNTWPLVYGPTRNPWDPERSAGGSSGGACAAVAAGLVPVAHASDGAGSIRIPAAWCGLVGLKPTRDRIVWRHAGAGRNDVEFVVARSLRDTAAFADVLCAHPPRDRNQRCEAALSRRPPTLRIALCVDTPAAEAELECRVAAQTIADRLSDLGHVVEAGAPETLAEFDDRSLHGAVLGPTEHRACLDELADRLGRPVGPDDVEPFLWELAQASGEPSEAELAAARAWTAEWVVRTLRWFDRWDVLLTPTVNEPSPRLSELDPHRLDPMTLLDRMIPNMAFTEPWNATGQPAITLPLGRSESGLPIGVQLVGRLGREDLLFAVAATLMPVEPEPGGPLPLLHA